jgi:predicted O-methyltransferase YrrM
MSFVGRCARGVGLGACAAALLGSPSLAQPGEADLPAASEASGKLGPPFWLNRWRKLPHDAPMYLRLPAGVDQRDWDAMSEGYAAWLKSQKRFDTPTADHYEKGYEFTWDVFTWNVPLWRSILEPFVGRPDLLYLEIGVAEGRALLWMLENVLTDPTSRATGIDPFMVEGHEARFHENLKKSPGANRVRMIKGFSQDVLPELEPDSYDIIYIDGSHLAGDVLFDAVYTWRLLRDGGLVIHDDYMWQPAKPADMHPLVSVDAFVTGRRNTARVLHRGRQLVLQKQALELPSFCWNRDPCLRVGNYLYAWNSNRLLEIGTEKSIPLSKSERAVLQEILRSRRVGAEAELVLEQDVAHLRARHPEEFARLVELLDLRLAQVPQ